MTPDQILDGLRNLCGYVENGSDTKVCIHQDDATKTWVVTIGRHYELTFYGNSMSQALKEAIKDDARRKSQS